jgi:hypothetical protein
MRGQGNEKRIRRPMDHRMLVSQTHRDFLHIAVPVRLGFPASGPELVAPARTSNKPVHMSTTKKDNEKKKGQDTMTSSTKPSTSSTRTGGAKDSSDADEKGSSRTTSSSRTSTTRTDRDRDNDMDEDTNKKSR